MPRTYPARKSAPNPGGPLSKGSVTYAKMKLTQKDYELLMYGMGLATGYALKWDVYGVTGSDPNAISINTKLLDLMNRIMDAKDTYQEERASHRELDERKPSHATDRSDKPDRQDRQSRQDKPNHQDRQDRSGRPAPRKEKKAVDGTAN